MKNTGRVFVFPGKFVFKFLWYGQVFTGGRIVGFYNISSEKEIHKKNIEKFIELRYNYCVKLFIQSDPELIPAGEMR